MYVHIMYVCCIFIQISIIPDFQYPGTSIYQTGNLNVFYKISHNYSNSPYTFSRVPQITLIEQFLENA